AHDHVRRLLALDAMIPGADAGKASFHEVILNARGPALAAVRFARPPGGVHPLMQLTPTSTVPPASLQSTVLWSLATMLSERIRPGGRQMLAQSRSWSRRPRRTLGDTPWWRLKAILKCATSE